MRRRPVFLLLCGVFLSAACGDAERDTSVSAHAVRGLPEVAYYYYASAGSEGSDTLRGVGQGRAPSARSAYEKGLAALVAHCKTELSDCYQKGIVSVSPTVTRDGVSQDDVVRQFRYERTLQALGDAARALPAALEAAPTSRAVDIEASLLDTDARLASFEARMETAIRPLEGLKAAARTLPERVRQLGAELHGEEKAQLARHHLNLRGARGAIEAFHREFAEKDERYQALVAEYRALHEREGELASELQGLADEINEADLDSFPSLHHRLVELIRGESRDAVNLKLEARRVEAHLEAMSVRLDERLTPYRDFLDEEELAVPDPTGPRREVIRKMRAYLDSRVQRWNRAASEILAQVRRRRNALILVAADEKTRETAEAVTWTRASEGFLKEAGVLGKAAWSKGPMRGGVELLEPRYRAVQELLGTETLCDPELRSSWMAVGCDFLARDRGRARLYLEGSLPLRIVLDAGKLRGAGAPGELVDAMERAGESGDLERAVALHDQIAELVEEAR